MNKVIKDYWDNCYAIIVRPIYFYTKLKDESWKEASLTFLLQTSWILGFLATIVVFILQYLSVGGALLEGISGFKIIIILPVLLALIFVFFLITFLILGGLFAFSFFLLLCLVSIILHYTYLFLGGKGNLNRTLISSLYSGAVLLAGAFVFVLMIFTKYGGLDFSLFRVGYNFIYFLMLLYIYGLWAIAGRKTYGISRTKAFLGAAVPIIVLLIFGVLFDKIALSKLQPWIS